MKTVDQFIRYIGGCGSAQKKYKGRRDFKNVWINAHWSHAFWLGIRLYYTTVAKNLETFNAAAKIVGVEPHLFQAQVLAEFCQKKENRAALWPVVRDWIDQLGVNR